MAKLNRGNLTFEFRFNEYDAEGWVQYEVLFSWSGKPIINDSTPLLIVGILVLMIKGFPV